jgi:hypothetical protein
MKVRILGRPSVIIQRQQLRVSITVCLLSLHLLINFIDNGAISSRLPLLVPMVT